MQSKVDFKAGAADEKLMVISEQLLPPSQQ